MLRTAEGVEVGEDSVALHLARVCDLEVCRVGVHSLHFLPNLFCRIGKIDAVAQRLAHLGATVGAREAAAYSVVGKHDFRLHEHVAVVGAVELADNLAGLLNHRLLVIAGRDNRGLERRDVRCLAHRVGEESGRDALALELAHLDFALHRRVALEACDGDKIHIVERQLAELGDERLYENGHF